MSVAHALPGLSALGLDLGHVGAPVPTTNLDGNRVVDGGCIHVTCGRHMEGGGDTRTCVCVFFWEGGGQLWRQWCR